MPPYSNVITEDVTEIPRARSMSSQSERVRRRSPRALTWPAIWIAPPKYSSFSVSVVLPASGCEMIAKVRRGSMDEPRGAGRSRSVAVCIAFRSAKIGPNMPESTIPQAERRILWTSERRPSMRARDSWIKKAKWAGRTRASRPDPLRRHDEINRRIARQLHLARQQVHRHAADIGGAQAMGAQR